MEFTDILKWVAIIYIGYYAVMILFEFVTGGRKNVASDGTNSSNYEIDSLIDETETTHVDSVEKSDDLIDFEKKNEIEN